MPLNRKCCINKCDSNNKEKYVSFHYLPADIKMHTKWIDALFNYTGNLHISSLTDDSVVCSKHFAPNSFSLNTKRRLLITGTIPTVFNNAIEVAENCVLRRDASSQTIETHNQINDLLYTKKCLNQKLRRLQIRYNRLKQDYEIEKETKKQDFETLGLQHIKKDAKNLNPKAIMILDQIKNYKNKKPSWSEMTIRHCIAWRFCSPKGYEFSRKSLLRLPCKTTLSKYFGSNNENLIRDRLMCEIKNLNTPEKVCSLVVDDMAVREVVYYSKTEDRIFGLDTIKSKEEIGIKPVVANQLLCFVIHGLSTKYLIPVSYHFHRQLNSRTLYKLALDVLKLLADCGFKVIRIVADNHKSHVALFKHFGNGSLQNVIAHPYNPGLKLFLSFDYCHALKNGRNIFLDHDMASSDGIISPKFLNELFELQKKLIVKPVRYLTKKHLRPSNLEKMKVYTAVQLFSPPVTAALRYLFHHGKQEFSSFKHCIATVKYMENMYKFFQIHDVSNRVEHIHKRDNNTAPYKSIYDARLSWLNDYFPKYINNIQLTSAQANMNGLTKETAEALIFISKSSYLCIRYLIEDLNFYYVLTRSFSSDAVETLFSNIRLRGGSNDLTDCRAAEHAIKQILKSGLIQTVNSGNTMTNIQYTSTNKFECVENVENNENDEINIILNYSVIEKLEMLSTFKINCENYASIESAAMAFLCGYIIMKIEQSVNNCEFCLLSLRNLAPDKTHPLLELISNQNRGKLNYPSDEFVALIEFIITIIIEILPNLPLKNTNFILKKILIAYLQNHSIFTCKIHPNIVCSVVVEKLVPPILTNYCNIKSQDVKTTLLEKKRKLLKIN